MEEKNNLQIIEQHDEGILSEVEMQFSEMNEISEGMCSCVCINDEQCCGCMIQ